MTATEVPFDINQYLSNAMSLPPIEPKEDEFVLLCQQFQRSYSTLPNLVQIPQPVTIVGSVHAQLDDIHEMFDVCGAIPYTSYLFLGDFVNYGDRNIATVALLFSLALKYPDHVYLLRGAHESRRLTLVCGLYEEIINSYGSPRAWEALMDAFDALPLAAQVSYQYFCLSGGIDKNITKLNQINEFNRFVEVPLTDSWSSLVWSIAKEGVKDFTPIENGRHGFFFGEEQVNNFLKANGLTCMIHSKQLCMNGHSSLFGGKVITVWSAPNFNGWIQNAASVVQMVAPTSQFGQKSGSQSTLVINTFKARPESERTEPNRPPFQDVHSLDHIYIKHLPKLP